MAGFRGLGREPVYDNARQRRNANQFARFADLVFGSGLDVNPSGQITVDLSELQHNDLGGLTTGDPHTQYVRRDILTTDGDLFTRVAGVIARLGIGSTGQMLTVAAGLPSWATPVTVLSGTYTPTLFNTTNLTASTAYVCQYMRVGNTVTVSGKVDVDPTLAGSTVLGISLPIASALAAAEQCAGAAASSGIAGQSAAILGDATNDRATMQWIAVDLTNQPMYFSFTYQVI